MKYRESNMTALRPQRSQLRVVAPLVAGLMLFVGIVLALPQRALAQDAPTDVSPFLITTGNEVFGLQGVLRTAVGQPFGTFLVADGDGAVYGLVGATPAVDRQIEQYNLQRTTVRVWGTLFPGQNGSAVQQLLVNDILPVSAATPVPTPGPNQGVSLLVQVAAANVRSGPSTAYPVVGSVNRGQNCPAIGRNADISWLQAACPGVTGWISADLLQVTGNAAQLPIVTVGPPPVAPPTPAPTPTPPPAPVVQELPPGTNNWGAAYWSNMWLGGSPNFANYEPTDNYPIDRNWGMGAPAPGLPADNFSVRWRGNFQFAAGSMVFRARADDGVRVWLDGHIVIDAWTDGPKDVSNTFANVGAGMHLVTVEYYENMGDAYIQMGWSRASGGSGSGTGGGGGSDAWRPDE